MSGAALETLYNLGYSLTSQVLGSTYSQYRPTAATAAIVSGNLLGTMSAWLTTDPALKGPGQPLPGKPLWYGAFDRSNVDVGDYLVGPDGTFFVASLVYPGAPMLVWCNRTLTLQRAVGTLPLGPAGAGSYGGTSVQNPVTVLTAWPGSLLQMSSGSKMAPTGMSLPSDAKLPGVSIMLPPLPAGLSVEWNDIVVDEVGQRYSVAMTELTPLGWRLTAEMWPT